MEQQLVGEAKGRDPDECTAMEGYRMKDVDIPVYVWNGSTVNTMKTASIKCGGELGLKGNMYNSFSSLKLIRR